MCVTSLSKAHVGHRGSGGQTWWVPGRENELGFVFQKKGASETHGLVLGDIHMNLHGTM